MRRLVLVCSLAITGLIGCTSPGTISPSTEASEAEIAEEIKRRLPDAAAMPAHVLRLLANTVLHPSEIDGDELGITRVGSVTWAVLSYRPLPGKSVPEEITLGDGEVVDPVTIYRALETQDTLKASVIQPQYITEFSCKVTRDEAKGTVRFEAKGAFRGKVDYRARRQGSDWRIEEFRFPKLGITISRTADDYWKLTRPSSMLNEEDRLRTDLRKLQGNWLSRMPRKSPEKDDQKSDSEQQSVRTLVIQGTQVRVFTKQPGAEKPTEFLAANLMLQNREGQLVLILHQILNRPGQMAYRYILREDSLELLALDFLGSEGIPGRWYRETPRKTETPVVPPSEPKLPSNPDFPVP